MGIADLYKEIGKAFGNLPVERVMPLYASNVRPDRWENLVAEIAAVVYESLESIANSFQGYDDPNWHHAISVFQDLFPVYGDTLIGFDPFQQRLAIMLIEKLSQNMEGFYPSISRVLLAVIGPYERHGDTGLTAFGILRDAVYKECLKLKRLHAEKPDGFDDYFPNNVKYDPAVDTLTFTYRLGDPVTTSLADLKLGDINLLDPRYRRWMLLGDAMGWAL
jgi:hypothetical protein